MPSSCSSFTYEIIIVDDCSTDNTVQVVQDEVKKHTIERIRLLQLQVNHGKGGAIRKAVMRARGAKILFADADNATEIRDYVKLEAAMDAVLSAGAQGVVICGSRAHLEEQAIAKVWRLRQSKSTAWWCREKTHIDTALLVAAQSDPEPAYALLPPHRHHSGGAECARYAVRIQAV